MKRLTTKHIPKTTNNSIQKRFINQSSTLCVKTCSKTLTPSLNKKDLPPKQVTSSAFYLPYLEH